jgi:hypothetical protein
MDALDPPVDRIGLTYHKAGRLQAVDQGADGNATDVELVGELGLGHSVLARDEREHPPLRAGNRAAPGRDRTSSS